ncbi:twin-arginine translocase TatA/TatE family subunit [Pseudomonas sp. BN414]|uniref:twin-arginine translocase TatA/TatE family subunit n=1 Tax=Pseudomonas sp. BN414 TaxID=2567888 RepID=UPI0024557DD9|nr:twin-arginine translocase TatA/TatE family subunit [Pseudomonas sp. BN414]MDH4567190.1 twin-arginine translocase TatA/TatE family subunit [Pseudomonas sp. BN414]
MGIFDWKHWLVLLLVVLVLFGGKRLKSLGADLGESIRTLRRALATEGKGEPHPAEVDNAARIAQSVPAPALRPRPRAPAPS